MTRCGRGRCGRCGWPRGFGLRLLWLFQQSAQLGDHPLMVGIALAAGIGHHGQHATNLIHQMQQASGDFRGQAQPTGPQFRQ